MIEKCFVCCCDIDTSKMNSSSRSRSKIRGRFYCSTECSKKYRRQISSITMAKTNRKYASERMLKNNPMRKKECRDKVSATHKRNGYKPKIRGGNGQGMPVPHELLFRSLGDTWVVEYPVRTNITKDNNPNRYPTCYKVDLALVDKKIAVEVDGPSHQQLSKQAQDKKKDKFLVSNGWKVIRIKNKEVMTDIKGCLSKISAIVNSMDEGLYKNRS